MTTMPAQRVAPAGVNFSSLLPLGVRGVSKSRRFQPNNGQAFTSVNNIIRIPLASTGFLDTQHSYLSFTVNVAGGVAGGIAMEGGASCFIRTLRIEGSDGAELERVDNYNVIAAALNDLQVGKDHSDTIMNAMDITYQPQATANYVAGYTGEPSTGACPLPAVQGLQTFTNAATDLASGVSVKLISGLLSNPKYLPMGFIAGGGVVIELTLDNDASCLFDCATAATAATYTLTNVQYIGQVVEMADSFSAAFRAMLNEQSGIQWSGQTLRGHTFGYNSVPGLGFQAVVPVAERAKSIKAIYTIFRMQAQLNDIDQHTFTSRTWNGCVSYQVRIGSNVYPSQPVLGGPRNPSQFVAELYKSVASLGDVRQGGKITRANYVSGTLANPQVVGNPLVAAGGILAARTGSTGFFGIDLETYAQSSDVLESGIDTSSLSLPINIEFTLSTAALGTQTGQVVANSFALVDVLYSLDASGLLTAAM